MGTTQDVDGSAASPCSTDVALEPPSEAFGREVNRVNRAEALAKVKEVLEADTADPAAELRKMGEVLMKIGAALDGLSINDARAVIRAVANLEGVSP